MVDKVALGLGQDCGFPLSATFAPCLIFTVSTSLLASESSSHEKRGGLSDKRFTLVIVLTFACTFMI
jgi:hypothetical protein